MAFGLWSGERAKQNQEQAAMAAVGFNERMAGHYWNEKPHIVHKDGLQLVFATDDLQVLQGIPFTTKVRRNPRGEPRYIGVAQARMTPESEANLKAWAQKFPLHDFVDPKLEKKKEGQEMAA